MSNRKVAALLNFLFWGIGYICMYNMKRKMLGRLLFAGYVLVHYYSYSAGFLFSPEMWFKMPYISLLLGHVFISVALAYDVYYAQT